MGLIWKVNQLVFLVLVPKRWTVIGVSSSGSHSVSSHSLVMTVQCRSAGRSASASILDNTAMVHISSGRVCAAMAGRAIKAVDTLARSSAWSGRICLGFVACACCRSWNAMVSCVPPGLRMSKPNAKE